MLIRVRDLRVSYGSVEVLHGINLEVGAGEFVSIVGKSGCGKSTLLLALAGFVECQGDVHFPGEFGIVFQNYAVFPWMTVRDNIAFGLWTRPAADREAIVDRHLSLVGLQAHADKYPSLLSGGQAQRVALARALAADPAVVLMDEPFGALDTFTRNQMQQWLAMLWQGGSKTGLFVTHNIEEAIFLSDRIILMDQGRILTEVGVEVERPRDSELKYSGQFVELRRSILERLGTTEPVRS
jgi:NitT/TauT family transport system ATP-binding protein